MITTRSVREENHLLLEVMSMLSPSTRLLVMTEVDAAVRAATTDYADTFDGQALLDNHIICGKVALAAITMVNREIVELNERQDNHEQS